MRNTKKIISLILCLLLCLSVFTPVYAEPQTNENAADAAEEPTIVIEIRSAKDLKKLGANCVNDTWSSGKKVVLKKDIDLSKEKYTPIPTFGGVFDGEGHTISGIRYVQNGTVQGFFRYIQAGAVVQNLNVAGTITPGGTKSTVGGIAGENNGTISNCSFKGFIKGTSNIGGIAGLNQGDISNCTAEGSVYGEHYAGGITGKNLGTVLLCMNYAKVNTVVEEVKPDLENIDFKNLRSTENTVDITDIGGIAGYSGGILQSCTNNGTVGYEHVGYNIGGIAGRQAGYISNCKNTGVIHGRKDVGGIVGQMEPYTVLEYSRGSLEDLEDELDNLQGVVDRAVENSRNSKNNVSAQLDVTQGYIKDARTITRSLIDSIDEQLNKGIDNLNDTTAQINNLSARASILTDDAIDVFDSLSASSDNIRDVIKDCRTDIKAIKGYWEQVDTDNIEESLDELSSAIGSFSGAASDISKSLRNLDKALGDTNKVYSAMQQLSKAFGNLETASGSIASAANKIARANKEFLKKVKNGEAPVDEAVVELITKITDALDGVSGASGTLKSSAADIAKALLQIGKFIADIDGKKLETAFTYLQKSVDNLSTGMNTLYRATQGLSAARKELKEAFDKTKDTAENGDIYYDKLEKEADNISSALEKLRNSVKDFNDNTSISIKKMDNVQLEEKDALSDALTNISDSVDSVRTAVSGFGDSLADSITAVSDQMSVIFDCMTNVIDDAINKSTDPKDYIEDVSESDTESQTEGKVTKCKNSGEVNGDLNVGGIAGSLAIEYDFDPEEDVVSQGKKTMNFMYTTKAIISHCTNTGFVNAKKSYAGGIAGKEELGLIYDCLGKGKITSKTGDYTGGIAGYSDSFIKNSYAKCTLSGRNYLGGIAGEGDKIFDCMAIVNVEEASEYIGSIAGKATTCTGNFFANNGFGGIDNISYAGKAQGVSYEKLVLLDGVPADFNHFTLTFKADGKTVGTVDFGYGETVPENKLPAIPKKDGQYGKWDKDSFEHLTFDDTIEAVYDSYILSIESSEVRRNGLPVVVAAGEFSSASTVTIEKAEPEKSELERWNIQITDNNKKEAVIHYLPKKEFAGKKLRVSYESGGKWQKATVKEDGSCIVFTLPSDAKAFSVSKKTPWGTIVLLSVLILAVILIIRFRKQIKKALIDFKKKITQRKEVHAE